MRLREVGLQLVFRTDPNKWGICMETHCNCVATSRIKVWKSITNKLRQESKNLYVVSRNT